MLPTRSFILFLTALSSSVLAQDAQPDGGPCAQDSDCNSRWCNVPPVGPGERQCLTRPALIGASCIKEQETSDCDSGYCDEATNTCQRIPLGSACTDDNQCDEQGVCDFQARSSNKICLAVGLPDARGCNVGRQCQSGCCPDLYFQCRPASECQSPITPGSLEQGATCSSDFECGSGLCGPVFDDDAGLVVCLASNQEENQPCSQSRQCKTNYCMPFDTPAEAPNKPNTCGKEYSVGGPDPSSTPSNPGTPSGPSTTPSTPGTGQTGENTDETGDENVETITTVINGQTSTVIRTRTVFVSASRTASRVASGSASRSASAVAAAGGAERSADRGVMWKLAGLASVVAVLMSVALV